MSTVKTTYQRAQDQIGAYVQAIRPGMSMPPFNAKDEQGRWLRSSDDHLSGKTLLILALNTNNEKRIGDWIDAINRVDTRLRTDAFSVIAFSTNSDAADNERRCRVSGFGWPMPTDASGQILAGFGLHKGETISDRLLLVSPFSQIIRWWDEPQDLGNCLEEAMSTMTTNTNTQESLMPIHAPVLNIPNVITPAECAELIRAFESDTPFTVRPPKPDELVGNFSIPVYEHNRQDRIDCIIRDQAMLQFLDERIFGRVVPMVKKAFAFDITRREDLHIARYEGTRSGNQMGHRDNVSAPTAHRRFALSLNLNDDYDGGDVVFKEFGDRGYKSSAGSALIFSSSLLHEVRETTKGTRFTLISHFFNDQSLTQKPA